MNLHRLAAGNVCRPQRQLTSPLRELNLAKRHRLEVLCDRLLPFGAIVVWADDWRVVGLGEILQLDSTIGELADLPSGWCAWRDTPESLWQRARQWYVVKR